RGWRREGGPGGKHPGGARGGGPPGFGPGRGDRHLLRLELLGGGSRGPGRGVAVDPAGAPLDAGPLLEPGRLRSSMSRRLSRAAVLALALYASAVRSDDGYVWTDATGGAHYTNDLASIPEHCTPAVRE